MFPQGPLGNPYGQQRPAPLMMFPQGAFPVRQGLQPDQFPPAVRKDITRIFEDTPKPVVTLDVMNNTQASMIQPFLPWQATPRG